MTEAPIDSNSSWAETIRGLKLKIDKWLKSALGLGLIVSALFGLTAGARTDTESLLSHILGMLIAMMIVGGALALGTVAGFLFGLPRALTGDAGELARLNAGSANADVGGGAQDGEQGSTAANQSSSGGGGRAAIGGFGANTNLERISDWLTTIIIGIGLANLASLPGAVERFGSRVDQFFAFGGHAFAVGSGIYFLIFGFLMSYISTRTKLMIIFTENERDKQVVESGALIVAVRASASGGSIPTFQRAAPAAAEPPPGSAAETAPATRRPEVTAVSQADKVVLEKVSMQPNQTHEQMLAVAKATARAGDFAKALVMYRDYMNVAPFDPLVAADYAGVLGMNADLNGLEELKEKFHAHHADPEIATAENSFDLGLRAALQANLYNSRYEDAIRIGEMLVKRLGPLADSWTHLWLACAYGQRHRAVEQRGGEAEERTRARAVAEVEAAIMRDDHMRSYVRTLYVPGEALGQDDDLTSLYRYKALHDVLGVASEEETEA